jgi:hypothetical protein
MAPFLQTILLATLCILPTTLLALPIVGDTRIDSNGAVHPHTLITRDLQPVVFLLDNRALGGLVPTGDSSASGPTGSSAAATGLTGTSGSSESASEGTSSSSSTSCRELFLLSHIPHSILPPFLPSEIIRRPPTHSLNRLNMPLIQNS